MNLGKKDGLNSFCRDCNKAYLKKHYRDNKQYYLNKNKKRKLEIRLLIDDIKDKSSCQQCEESHPAALDFHHRDMAEKDMEVSRLSNSGWSKERILKEIQKCDILCANCHRKLHYREG